MRALIVFSVLAAAWAYPSSFSFSPAVGSGSGTSYTITGEGRITAVRLWENSNGHVRGIQVRYGFAWSEVAGYTGGETIEMELFDGEFIVQVSGKFAHYIQSLMIVTSRGRFIIAGQPSGTSFNMYPTHPMAELRFLSGRYHGGLTSIGTHWAVLPNMAVNGTSD